MTPEEQAAADAIKAAVAQKAADEKAAADKSAADKAAEAKLFTQSDLDRIVKDRLADEQRRAQQRIDAEKAAAETQRLKDQGEYKVLAEQAEARAKDLEAQIAAKDRAAMRVKAGASAKLPEILYDRIQGETEAEMIADAQALAKTVAPPSPGNINPGGTGTTTGKPTVEEARQRLLKSGDYHRI